METIGILQHLLLSNLHLANIVNRGTAGALALISPLLKKMKKDTWQKMPATGALVTRDIQAPWFGQIRIMAYCLFYFQTGCTPLGKTANYMK